MNHYRNNDDAKVGDGVFVGVSGGVDINDEHQKQ